MEHWLTCIVLPEANVSSVSLTSCCLVATVGCLKKQVKMLEMQEVLGAEAPTIGLPAVQTQQPCALSRLAKLKICPEQDLTFDEVHDAVQQAMRQEASGANVHPLMGT